MIAFYRLGFLVTIFAVWTAAAAQMGANIVPSPVATFEAAKRLFAEGLLLVAVGDSMSIYLSGFALAILIAVPLGIIMGGFRVLGKTLEVYVFALAATPRVAFIPLIIVLLGLGIEDRKSVV